MCELTKYPSRALNTSVVLEDLEGAKDYFVIFGLQQRPQRWGIYVHSAL